MRLISRVLWLLVYPILKLLEPCIQRWVKPTNQSLVLGTVADLTRGRSELVLENAFLRQQVIVLSREKKRPPLTNKDRRLLVLLARLLPSWQDALMIVQPDTLTRWHRDLFKIVWRRKSKAKPKPQPATLPMTTIRLIWQLATDNRLWGAERIRGELLKLGYSGQQTHDPEVSEMHATLAAQRANLVHLRAQSCRGYLGVRLCTDLRCLLPDHLRVCDHRVGVPPGHSLQCDPVTFRCLGRPAIT
jgi:hypothetical protein